MKSIFIYPISYIFLWSFPFILQCFEFHDAKSSIVWLNAVLLFFQPFNCTVDTLVFLYRERPWTITTYKTDTNPLEVYEYPNWRKKLAWLPLYKLPTVESNQARHEKQMKKKQIQRQQEQEALAEQLKLKSTTDSSDSFHLDDTELHDFSKILSGDDLDFVKLPTPALKKEITGPSKSNTYDDRLTLYPDGLPPAGTDYDAKRRRSSKFSWLSSLSGAAELTDSRRRSSGTTLSTGGGSGANKSKPASETNSNNSENFNVPSASMFSLTYAMTEIAPKSLPKITERKESKPEVKDFAELKPHDSPTSPLQANYNAHEISNPPSPPPSTSPLHNTPHQSRSMANIFGITRRASFFDGMHSDSHKKRSPFSDDHRTPDPSDSPWGSSSFSFSANANRPSNSGISQQTDRFNEGLENEDDDDMDFLDFLKRGPPV